MAILQLKCNQLLEDIVTNNTLPMKYAQSKRIRPVMTPSQRIMKRAFDITVSSIVLFLTLPVMVMVSIAIMIYDPGPILFKQERVGENGKLFRIYKFRSMVVNADAMLEKFAVKDANGNMIHKHKDDPRVTPIGRIIRKTSLDELPQLINVIKGDMSLVGPRPELPKLVAGYENWQYERFSVPQGITGWWQVTGRSEKPCHLNTDQDVYYIKNYSLWMDIKIMLMTVPALLKGKGAF
jgi:exopolysaccharide biosynthesis polyprenyl glycosylphosphotransferase